MHFSTLTLVAILTPCTTAKICINVTVPVTISAQNGIYNIAIPQTNLEAIDFARNLTQQGRNFSDTVFTGFKTVQGTYNISTQFCTPTKGNATNATNPTIQVLTHGIGFDRTYWDLPFNNFNYSYVDVATDQYGYCTLALDRLGIANSSHGDPLGEIQAPLEIAATAALTRMLRNGSFPEVKHAFKKIVHVGHSFGSAQTYALASLYPNITDGIILTGYSSNASFSGLFVAGNNFQQAALNQPLRFGSVSGSDVQSLISTYAPSIADYLSPLDFGAIPAHGALPRGYLVNSDAAANKYLFLYPGYYDPAILDYAEATKQPVTLGELLSLGGPPENVFAGPVFVINGEGDLPYCGFNCSATGGVAPSIAAMVKKSFPSVAESNFSSYIQPNTGHGINLHYNATAAYKVWLDFLGTKNLRTT